MDAQAPVAPRHAGLHVCTSQAPRKTPEAPIQSGNTIEKHRVRMAMRNTNKCGMPSETLVKCPDPKHDTKNCTHDEFEFRRVLYATCCKGVQVLMVSIGV
jgi:hypothetical protein